MTSAEVGAVFFVFTFGAALAGMKLRSILPENHFEPESRDAVKLGIGLVATISALVLGLVTASAKSSFDTQDAAIKHTAADVLTLDRTLARFGAEAAPARASLKVVVGLSLTRVWPDMGVNPRSFDPASTEPRIEQVVSQIRQLAPRTEEQRFLQTRALDLCESVLGARWLIFASLGSSVPLPFLAILLFWLAITFMSFGLFGPSNATVVTTLFVCALSVAGAVFLVLELDDPFTGLITVSSGPMEFALERIDK